MTTKSPGTTGLRALWFAPVVIVVLGFFAAIPWLKQLDDTYVLVLGG